MQETALESQPLIEELRTPWGADRTADATAKRQSRLRNKKVLACFAVSAVAIISFFAGAGFTSHAMAGDIAFTESELSALSWASHNAYTATHGHAGKVSESFYIF
jgi:hypothetical protein